MNWEYDGHFGKPKSEVRPNLDRYIREKAFVCTREAFRVYRRRPLRVHAKRLACGHVQTPVRGLLQQRCNGVAMPLQWHLNTV